MNIGQVYHVLGVTQEAVPRSQLAGFCKQALIEAHRDGDTRRMQLLSQAKEALKRFTFPRCSCGAVINRGATRCRTCRWGKLIPFPVQRAA